MMDRGGGQATLAKELAQKPRRQPPYHVLSLDDDDHTSPDVIKMLRWLFGHTVANAFQNASQVARDVDSRGPAIALTTSGEHVELKWDQDLWIRPGPAAAQQCWINDMPDRTGLLI